MENEIDGYFRVQIWGDLLLQSKSDPARDRDGSFATALNPNIEGQPVLTQGDADAVRHPQPLHSHHLGVHLSYSNCQSPCLSVGSHHPQSWLKMPSSLHPMTEGGGASVLQLSHP